MEKYNSEKPTLKKRTEKNKELYKNINEGYMESHFDLNSNMTVLNADSKVIDVDKIRDMLDRKYRVDNERKHLEVPEFEEQDVEMYDTKEYDINTIIEKAKANKNFDYEKERLKSVHNTQYDILKNLDISQKEDNISDDEENLVNLINTITALELKNKNNKKKQVDALEMLTDFKEDNETEIDEVDEVDEEPIMENTFSNNQIINFGNEDYEDFEDLKNDIKSNSILIKIVGILFILILLVGALILANNYLDLGLF